MYQVKVEKIDLTNNFRVDIYKENKLIAGMLTYETTTENAVSRAAGLIKSVEGEKKYAAYIPIR